MSQHSFCFCKENKSSSFSLSSYSLFHSPVISPVALILTLTEGNLGPFDDCGDQIYPSYSRCGLTSELYKVSML